MPESGLLITFVKVTGKKLVVGPFCPLILLILKTVKGNLYFFTRLKSNFYTLVAYYEQGNIVVRNFVELSSFLVTSS